MESGRQGVEPARRARLRTARVETALGFRARFLEQLANRTFAQHFDAFGVTPALYFILLLIEDNPACRQADLALALKVQQPNLVERVGLLIERGLIARSEDPQDRRANVLRLTPAGARFMADTAAAWSSVIDDLRSRLGPEAHDALLKTIPTGDGLGPDA